MGKVQDTIDWFKEKTEKVKDTFGTGIEALNPAGLATILENKRRK
jgi:hypothetical protein